MNKTDSGDVPFLCHREKIPALLFAAAALIMAAVLSGCDRQTRYAFVTTVFTGVPPYEDYYAEKKDVEEEVSSAASDSLAYIHPVYRAGKCGACHKDAQSPGQAAGSSAETPPELVLPENKLCVATCHIDKTAKRAVQERLWLHNPVAKGDCLACHAPHQSDNPGLTILPGSEMCLHCHGKDSLSPEGHAGGNLNGMSLNQCRQCHNAHAGKDGKLLAKDYAEKKVPAMMPAK